MNPEEILAQIAAEVSTCQNCDLHHSRKRSVPGVGPANAEIMFIGEGPGYNENEQGLPFVGAAGKFLDELLAEGGLVRADVWIGNVVKCRPPDNRDPLPDELAACNHYLERQMAAIDPKIIVTLGRHSMGKFFADVKISAIHGQMRKVGDRFIIAMFHPAAALHQAKLKPTLLVDFSQLPAMLERARSLLGASNPVKPADKDKPSEAPKQLSLF
jgi:uracil-DNA glycosylase family 4